jgi:hypothetical protein
MILPFHIVKRDTDEYGRKYIDIFIIDGDESKDNKDLAIMTVYLESDTKKNFKRQDKINISYVEKYDKKLKGCFREFIKILVFKNAEIFGRKLSNSTEVLLFISPQQPPGGIDFDESFSIEQLKKLYKAIGFRNYDPSIPLFMVTTLSKLKYVLGGREFIDDPYKTPNESFDQGSPIKPEKPKNKEYLHISDVPAFKLYIPPSYLKTTASSRAKNIKSNITKRGGHITNRKTRKNTKRS